MDLIEIGLEDSARIADYASVHSAADAADAPWSQPFSAYRLEMWMRHGWDGEPSRWFVAYDGGRAVGTGNLNTSNYDNLELAWLGIEVHPELRRRGLGKLILEELVRLARDMGRPLIGLDGWESEAGDGFARKAGFELKQYDVARRQVPAQAPDAARLYAEAAAHAGDYELERIVGYSPDDLLAELAEATSAINDAPIDDLEYEDEVFDAGRVKAYETAHIEAGRRLYRLLARHRATGEIAGLTVVAVDADMPEWGSQHDTSVVRAHRGHRLGMLLKSAMLLWLAETEPQLKAIDTYNAESNDHMIGVNEALGYQVLSRVANYQRRY